MLVVGAVGGSTRRVDAGGRASGGFQALRFHWGGGAQGFNFQYTPRARDFGARPIGGIAVAVSRGD